MADRSLDHWLRERVAAGSARRISDSTTLAHRSIFSGLRLLVYADFPYRLHRGALHAEYSFVRLVTELRRATGSLALAGRLSPGKRGPRHPVPPEVEFVALPDYPSLGRPLRVMPALARSLRTFDDALGRADAVWLLGPHPLSVAFAVLALARRRRVFLGVRQDYLRYVRYRYPGRPMMWVAGAILHLAFLALALRAPVVTVGPSISRRYRHARRVLELVPSLVRADEIVPIETALERSYDAELMLLSVGRLDPEKDPLLLVDVLTCLVRDDPRWRLIVCGEGTLEDELRARLERLGIAERAEFRGYVASASAIRAEYRSAHAFLHVSRTEGGAPPQVVLEAFAAGLPAVATDVGDLRTVGAACLLVESGDAEAAAVQLGRIGADAELRRTLVEHGHEFVSRHTIESECDRLARFLLGEAAVDRPGRIRTASR